jgi:hypothetical protein
VQEIRRGQPEVVDVHPEGTGGGGGTGTLAPSLPALSGPYSGTR